MSAPTIPGQPSDEAVLLMHDVCSTGAALARAMVVDVPWGPVKAQAVWRAQLTHDAATEALFAYLITLEAAEAAEVTA